uniref:G_PROTEIN_RECEP_F1_2 domain-containing protein n=1 Tax=Panagrellus redivivus TaxID=6233 RepID=A0A7E4VEX8_PANRE
MSNLFTTFWKVHVYGIIASCTVFYSYMFVKIREIRYAAKNSSIRSEIKLMYSAVILFVCNLFYVIYWLVRDMVIKNFADDAYLVDWTIYLLSDVYDLHNVYAILFTSKEVRAVLWKTKHTECCCFIQCCDYFIIMNLDMRRHYTVILLS